MNVATEDLLECLAPGTGVVHVIPFGSMKPSSAALCVRKEHLEQLDSLLQTGHYREVSLSVSILQLEDAVFEVLKKHRVSHVLLDASSSSSQLFWKTLRSEDCTFTHATCTLYFALEIPPAISVFPKLRHLRLDFAMLSLDETTSASIGWIIRSALASPNVHSLEFHGRLPATCNFLSFHESEQVTFVSKVKEVTWLAQGNASQEVFCCDFFLWILNRSPNLQKVSWTLDSNSPHHSRFVQAILDHPAINSVTMYMIPARHYSHATGLPLCYATLAPKCKHLAFRKFESGVKTKPLKPGLELSCFQGLIYEEHYKPFVAEVVKKHRFSQDLEGMYFFSTFQANWLDMAPLVSTLEFRECNIGAANVVDAIDAMLYLKHLSFISCSNVPYLNVVAIARRKNLCTLEINHCNRNYNVQEGGGPSFKLITEWIDEPSCKLSVLGLASLAVPLDSFLIFLAKLTKNKTVRVLDLTATILTNDLCHNIGFHMDKRVAEALRELFEQNGVLSSFGVSSSIINVAQLPRIENALDNNYALVNTRGLIPGAPVLTRNRLSRVFCRTCVMCWFWTLRQVGMGRDVARLVAKQLWETRHEPIWAEAYAKMTRLDNLKELPYIASVLVEPDPKGKDDSKCNLM